MYEISRFLRAIFSFVEGASARIKKPNSLNKRLIDAIYSTLNIHNKNDWGVKV